MDFLILNGEIIRKEEANLTSLFWNDPVVISQKIWFGFGGIPLFVKNINFLCRQLDSFNIETPKFLKNTRELFRISKRMLNKNKFYRSGIINIQLYLNDLQIDYVITSIAFPEFDFPITKHGLLVNFSEIEKYSENPLNRYSCYNFTNWKIIESQLRNFNFQSSIILNEKGKICEGIAANIFMVKDSILITPSLESGCYEDTMRNSILEVASKLQLKTLELPNITKKQLLEMSEIFFASEENGIQWILGIENKRFVHHLSKQLQEKLNDFLKEIAK